MKKATGKEVEEENQDFLNKMKNNSEISSFKCEECDMKVDTISMLKFHMRSLQFKFKQTPKK